MITIHAAARKVVIKQQQLQHKHQPKPKKKLRVVEDKRHQSISLPEIPFPVFIMSVSLLTAGIIINVAQQAIVSQLSYEVESVKKEIQLAQQEQDKLLAEKSDLESPQRIEAIALSKLAMVKAPKVSYLRIADNMKVDNTSGGPVSAKHVSDKSTASASSGKSTVNKSTLHKAAVTKSAVSNSTARNTAVVKSAVNRSMIKSTVSSRKSALGNSSKTILSSKTQKHATTYGKATTFSAKSPKKIKASSGGRLGHRALAN